MTTQLRARLVVLGLSSLVRLAAAQPDGAARCAVDLVRVPDDVRPVIERWVHAEPRCNVALEVRVVTSEGGLYVFARDERGRIHERIVPDATSAAVLIASWAADDSLDGTPRAAATRGPVLPAAPLVPAGATPVPLPAVTGAPPPLAAAAPPALLAVPAPATAAPAPLASVGVPAIAVAPPVAPGAAVVPAAAGVAVPLAPMTATPAAAVGPVTPVALPPAGLVPMTGAAPAAAAVGAAIPVAPPAVPVVPAAVTTAPAAAVGPAVAVAPPAVPFAPVASAAVGPVTSVAPAAVPVGPAAVPAAPAAIWPGTAVGPAAAPVGPAAIGPGTAVGPAAVPVGPAAVPVGPAAVPVGPAAVPVGPAAVPVGPAAVPVGPAAATAAPGTAAAPAPAPAAAPAAGPAPSAATELTRPVSDASMSPPSRWLGVSALVGLTTLQTGENHPSNNLQGLRADVDLWAAGPLTVGAAAAVLRGVHQTDEYYSSMTLNALEAMAAVRASTTLGSGRLRLQPSIAAGWLYERINEHAGGSTFNRAMAIAQGGLTLALHVRPRFALTLGTIATVYSDPWLDSSLTRRSDLVLHAGAQWGL